MSNYVSSRLSVPSLSVVTNAPLSSRDHDSLRPDTPLSAGFPSLQVPSSPTSRSLDGETLRSRANSFLSKSDTTRSRGYSDAHTIASTLHGEAFAVDGALNPDSSLEDDFEIPDNPFAFSPGQLNKLLNPKSLAAYKALGGLRGLERGLRTDVVAGLSVDETSLEGKISFEDAISPIDKKSVVEGTIIAEESIPITDRVVKGQYKDRLRVFKDNRLPLKKPVTIWQLFWNAYNDRILFLLTAAAIISLALGIYEAVGVPVEPGQPQSVDWVEGLAILIAVIIVVLVTGLNDFQREKQFSKLNAQKEDRTVKAIRSGKSIFISVYDVTVGDVIHLESGDSIPADGILISGHGIVCDESSATGESDAMKKTPGPQVWRRLDEGTATSKLDPFIISGTKVLEGVGTFMATSVGVNSSHGKIMVSLQTEQDPTPLQVKLGKLANQIGYLGTAAAGILFFILLIRFLVGLSSNTESPAKKGQQFLNILIVAVTIIVVAVPEGLPLSVTLALSFATKRMYKENNLVRHLRACETMGNATTICSDKTGTLTQNKMTVVAGSLGTTFAFGQASVLAEGDEPVLPFATAFSKISSNTRTLLIQSIAINSTAIEGEENGQNIFIGSKTETALLALAREHLGIGPIAEERAGVEVVQLIPFDSNRKCMGVVIRLHSGGYRLLVKGAAEIMLTKATKKLHDPLEKALREAYLSVEGRLEISSEITNYAKQSLRTIALLYRNFSQWPPAGVRMFDDNRLDFDDMFQEMTYIGIVGIQDPLREGVVKAVQQCQMAGIKVRMVTGDNVTTATAIATQCGIKTADGIVMEGPAFRKLSPASMDAAIPRLEVLARSSPEDKRILVARLKHLGETVAVTGDGTNDAPALKTADIGFSMGIAGTEVAKEASSIILMDDNFSSIIQAIMWGRSVNDAVAKFLQFQITVNITAVILAFVSAVYSPTMSSVLSAVQLLWVNLIMDTFAALALATDAPTPQILDRKPSPKSAPLITTTMWKMITGQAIYQLVVTFTLYFAGASILGYDVANNPILGTQLNTIVFNTFVWMQIFNEFNNRRLDNKFNIFEGMFRNWFFLGINAIMIGGQILIVFIGGLAFQITALNGTQWAICIICALPCLLWALVLRCIPDQWAARVFGIFGKAWNALLRSIVLPTQRAAKRMIRKPSGHEAEAEVERPTEDHQHSVELGFTHEDLPAHVTSPISPPPITFTTVD